MFLVIVVSISSKISLENVDGGDLQVFRKGSLIEIYIKLIFQLMLMS